MTSTLADLPQPSGLLPPFLSTLLVTPVLTNPARRSHSRMMLFYSSLACRIVHSLGISVKDGMALGQNVASWLSITYV